VVSSLKPALGGGVALRVYECNGKPASRKLLKLHTNVATANEVNLMEDPGRIVPVEEDGLRFDTGPFEIKTFLLRPPPGKTP
jgi:alpha-mannosidase